MKMYPIGPTCNASNDQNNEIYTSISKEINAGCGAVGIKPRLENRKPENRYVAPIWMPLSGSSSNDYLTLMK